MKSYTLKKMTSSQKLDKTHLNLQLDNIEKQYDKLFKSYFTQLRNAIPPQEIWRLFIDGNRQHQGWIAFEKTEPGYLHAMLLAFQKLFEPVSDLYQFIVTLHHLATNQVKNLNFDIESKDLYRTSRVFAVITYSTENGVDELIQYMKSYNIQDKDFPSITFFKSTEGLGSITIATPIQVLKSLHQDSFKSSYIDVNALAEKNSIPCYFSSKNVVITSITDEKLINELKKPGATFFLEHFLDEKQNNFNNLFQLRMQKFIESYKQKILLSNSKLEKLKVIIHFIQNCERLHPFVDGNTRTFSMLLLNYLLLQNNFPFVIRDNPNCIYALSIDELVQDIINGMQQTLDLAIGIPPYKIELHKLCEKLTPHEKKHFDDLVLLEMTNRKNNFIPRIKEVSTSLLSPYGNHQEVIPSVEAKSAFDKNILSYLKIEGKGIFNKLDTCDFICIFDRLSNSDAKTQWADELFKINAFFENDYIIYQLLLAISPLLRMSFLIKHIESCLAFNDDDWNEIKSILSPGEMDFIKQRLDFIKINKPEILHQKIVIRYNNYKEIFGFAIGEPKNDDCIFIFEMVRKGLTVFPYLKHFKEQDIIKILSSHASISAAEKNVLRQMLAPARTFFPFSFFKPVVYAISTAVIGLALSECLRNRYK